MRGEDMMGADLVVERSGSNTWLVGIAARVVCMASRMKALVFLGPNMNRTSQFGFFIAYRVHYPSPRKSMRFNGSRSLLLVLSMAAN